MRNLVKNLLIRAAIAAFAAAGVNALMGHPVEHAAAIANPLCAPHPVKMPCLQPDGAGTVS